MGSISRFILTRCPNDLALLRVDRWFLKSAFGRGRHVATLHSIGTVPHAALEREQAV
jgi:hypothetical protein